MNNEDYAAALRKAIQRVSEAGDFCLHLDGPGSFAMEGLSSLVHEKLEIVHFAEESHTYGEGGEWVEEITLVVGDLPSGGFIGLFFFTEGHEIEVTTWVSAGYEDEYNPLDGLQNRLPDGDRIPGSGEGPSNVTYHGGPWVDAPRAWLRRWRAGGA